MDRTKFFDAVRPLFGGSLSQSQVDGMSALTNAGQQYGLTNAHHMANVLAQVFHETGRAMTGVKETVMPHHKDRNPSDAVVIGRLDAAYAKGQLPWVGTPYWRAGWFGRGMIQLTHKSNYERMGKRLGVDLVRNPNLALDRNISASVAVVGMKEGAFTGRKLSDFIFPASLASTPSGNPRRIVNGADGTDATIANYHRHFYAALVEAGWSSAPTPKPAPVDELIERVLYPRGVAWPIAAIIAAGALIAAFIFGIL